MANTKNPFLEYKKSKGLSWNQLAKMTGLAKYSLGVISEKNPDEIGTIWLSSYNSILEATGVDLHLWYLENKR